MNLNRQQSVVLGAVLIGLGIVLWLNLWWLVFPAVLAAGGVIGYRQRRKIGRTVEAVQIGIWGLGLALLALLGFWFPGILLLAGLSILARGREDQIDAQVQRTFGQARAQASSDRSLTVQQVPVSSQPSTPQPPATPKANETPAVGETTRLPE